METATRTPLLQVVRRLLLALICLWAAGCGGTPSNPECVVNCMQVSGLVSISPAHGTVAAGGSLQFTASEPNTFNTDIVWKVNGVIGGTAETGTISTLGLYTAPTSEYGDSSVNISARDQNQGSHSESEPTVVNVLAAHRIGVRAATPVAEFFDRSSGNSFYPRGNNYIRLGMQTDTQGNPTYYHSTFNVGDYDGNRAETALQGMQTRGYNTVRVWLNGCCQSSLVSSNGGLSSTYVGNVVDFLGRAKVHGVYVIFTIDWLPALNTYTSQYADCTQFSDYNALNLCAGGVTATASFFQDFVNALVSQKAPMDAIFAYELRNEFYYPSDQAPLNATSGLIKAADGRTYDMSNVTSRQAMMDNGLIFFTNQVRSAILSVDPTALVTVGFFWPQSPNPTRAGDARISTVYPAIANSTADFVDLHSYAIAGEITLPQVIQNYGLVGYQQQKPAMMGEFGAFKSDYPQIADGAKVLKDWQISGCPYNIKGWLLWTWDTEEPEQVPATWAALSQDGSIDHALSPTERPDPCQP